MSCLSPQMGLLLSDVISPPFQSSPPHHHLQLFSDFKTIYSGRASFPGLGMGRAFSLTTTGVVMISLNSLTTRASWHLWLIFKGCAFKAHFIAYIASILAGQSRSKNCLPFAALIVCYTAVFSVVTQCSSPQTAAENRTTFLSLCVCGLTNKPIMYKKFDNTWAAGR